MLLNKFNIKIVKDESGISAILAVVLIGALTIVFSASLAVSTMLGAESTINNDKSDDNYYLAESGTEDTLRILGLTSTFGPTVTINSPIGTYNVTVTNLGSSNYKVETTAQSGNILRKANVEFQTISAGPPEAANFGMFAGQELAFLHDSNSYLVKGSLKGDIYAKDRIRLVGFIVGDSTGATTTKIVSAGSYGSGNPIGSQNDQLYKGSQTYYTNMYTLNDLSTHTSATASHLTVYYKSNTLQSISLPSGSNNTKVLDPNLVVEEITNPDFDFQLACSHQTGEPETIYTYTNQTQFLAYVNANNGNLATGIHCIQTGNVSISSSVPITLNGSIITMAGSLTITNKLTLSNTYNLPVLASFTNLVLGYASGNNSAPYNAEITGILYAKGDITIGNYGKNNSDAPHFYLTGGIWSKKNLYILQSNNIRTLKVVVTFDPNITTNVKDFTSLQTEGSSFVLNKWEEKFD